MKKIKILLLFALLCSVVQETWARVDKWDGVTYTEVTPIAGVGSIKNVVCIKSAAQLAYVMKHFSEETGWTESTNHAYHPKYFREANYVLRTDIDMGDDVSWTPIGNKDGSISAFTGTFYGEGHTIRINIKGATENYQGLFARISETGKVQNLHVAGNISCTTSRMVGGIAGENLGTIENCWVSADVSSEWKESLSAYTAKVGGICGENNGTVQYCCMSGNVTNNDADVGGIVGYNHSGKTVNHVTFYGTRNSTHSQKSIYIGDGTSTNAHSDDLLDDSELETYLKSFTGNNHYRDAVKGPFVVNVDKQGYGTVTVNPTATRKGKTVSLKLSGYTTLKEFSVKDASGKDVTLNGNVTDGYTFTIQQPCVNVTAVFSEPYWTDADKRATEFSEVDEGNKIITIKTEAELGLLSHLSNNSDDYGKGWTFLLDNDLDMSQYGWMPICISGDTKRFCGTFNGQGHTISGINVIVGSNYNAGLFANVYDGTVKNLKLADSNIIKTENNVAGGIVGYLSGSLGTIENCSVESDVTVTGLLQCGGIAGHARGSITGCFSAATVDGIDVVGGIVGVVDDCNVIRNVSKATINCIDSKGHNIYGESWNKTVFKIEANYYVESDPLDDINMRANQVVLTDNLKGWGCMMGHNGSKTLYDCSGLTFLTDDQFIMEDKWYGGQGKTFYFDLKHTYTNATADGVKFALATEWEKFTPLTKGDDGYYSFTLTEDAMVDANRMVLDLTDNDDNENEEMLKFFNDVEVNVTLEGRTLYKNGSWNTIFLPFSVIKSNSPLEGAIVKTLESASFDKDNNKLVLKFSDDTPILNARVPYLVKWTETGEDIVEPTFKKVTISEGFDNESEINYIDFIGTLAPVTLNANDKSVLYLGASNTLYYPNTQITVGSCHAYFQLKDKLTIGNSLSSARDFNIVLDFGDDSGTTGIRTTLNPSQNTGEWYDLQGHRIYGQPTVKGVYIHNGRKVVIR